MLQDRLSAVGSRRATLIVHDVIIILDASVKLKVTLVKRLIWPVCIRIIICSIRALCRLSSIIWIHSTC